MPGFSAEFAVSPFAVTLSAAKGLPLVRARDRTADYGGVYPARNDKDPSASPQDDSPPAGEFPDDFVPSSPFSGYR